MAGNEGHFELGGFCIGRDFGGGDVEKAASADDDFVLFGVVGKFVREEADDFAGFFGDAAGDFDIARAAKGIVEVFLGETLVWGEGGASKTFFEEELTFERFEIGEGMNVIAEEAVEISAAVGEEVDFGRRGGGDGLIDSFDVFAGGLEGFGGLRAKEVVVPLIAGDGVDEAVIIAGVVFEGGFVFVDQGGVDELGIGIAEGVEVERILEIVKVAVGGVEEEIFYVTHAAGAFDGAEVEGAG